MTSHPKDMSDALIDVIAGAESGLRARAPAGAVGQRPHPGGDEPPLRPCGATSTWSAGCAAPYRTSRSPPTSSSAFPGETEEDFQETLSLVEECRFDGAFTFIYSPRRETDGRGACPAAWRPTIAEERMARLVELVQRLGRERNQALLGADGRGHGRAGRAAMRPVR